MKTVGTFEAKTRLSSLLEEVERGAEVTITKHGKPVARLVPVVPAGADDLLDVVQRLKAFRWGRTLKGVTAKELIAEGRR